MLLMSSMDLLYAWHPVRSALTVWTAEHAPSTVEASKGTNGILTHLPTTGDLPLLMDVTVRTAHLI